MNSYPPFSPESLLNVSPYARLIGMKLTLVDNELRFSLPFQQGNIGNDQLPALHGGLIGGFMEMAAIMHLLWIRENTTVPRTVDFSIDYLRPGLSRELYANCSVTKHGQQIANVQVSVWQDTPDKPVAVARAHFLLD